MNMKKSKMHLVVLLILVVIIIGGGISVYALSNNKSELSSLNGQNFVIIPSPNPDEDFTINYDNVFYEYPTNSNGQTYGSSSIPTEGFAPGTIVVLPDLIAAMGTNGKEGYVYQKDLDGELPNNPEEAVKYMKRKTPCKIPLYDIDGVTVIGEFNIG